MKKGITAAVLALVLVGLVWAICILIEKACALNMGSEMKLPLLAIGGVILLLLVLAAVSVLFGVFGLSDKTQALALPEGSVRAVLALSLVVLFAILSVFLFNSLSNRPQRMVSGLAETDKNAFLNNNKTASDIQADREGHRDEQNLRYHLS